MIAKPCLSSDFRKTDTTLSLPSNFRGPPAGAYQQKPPVREEFRRLAFEGVTYKLENPPNNKKSESQGPETVQKRSSEKQDQRQNDQRNADGVAEAIDRMLMAGGVLRDPVIPGAIAEHGKPLEGG